VKTRPTKEPRIDSPDERAASTQIRKTLIASRIKEALADLDAGTIARAMNVSRATVYDWSAGRFLPDVERLGEFAEITKVSPVWLLFGKGGKYTGLDRLETYMMPIPGNLFPNLGAWSPLAFEKECFAKIKGEAGIPADSDDDL
jgi:transcriptional regulator with XRE-family HTH domain